MRDAEVAQQPGRRRWCGAVEAWQLLMNSETRN